MRERAALVTGAASGIGAALARELAAGGHRVAVVDIDEEGGRRVADAIDGVFVRADLSLPGGPAAAVRAAVDECGGLDVVCLNAGIGRGTSFGPTFSEARYRRVLAVDLDAVVLGIQAALPHLEARRGGILVTSSIAGLLPSADLFYAAAKHAVVGLVRSWGLVLAAAGSPVRVVAVCPGFVATPLLGGLAEAVVAAGLLVADPAAVAAAALEALAAGPTGSVWQIQGSGPAVLVPPPEVPLARYVS